MTSDEWRTEQGAGFGAVNPPRLEHRVRAYRRQRPLDLMLRHHVGVRVERTIEVLDIDHNYFDDGE